MDEHVPKVMPGAKYRERPGWLDKTILCTIRAKFKACRNWHMTRSNMMYLDYCKQRNGVTSVIRKAVTR